MTIQGARKYEQIGGDAAKKILEALLTGANLPPRCALARGPRFSTNSSGQFEPVSAFTVSSSRSIGAGLAEVFVDLNPATGSWLEGWLALRSGTDIGTYYMAASECELTCEWLRATKLRRVSDIFPAEELKAPGFSPKVSQDALTEQAPPEPRLNVLNIVNGCLKVPDSIAQQWASHPRFGGEFEQWLAKFYEDFTTKTEDSTSTPPRKGTLENPPRRPVTSLRART